MGENKINGGLSQREKGATGFGLGVGHRPGTPLLYLFLFSALAYPHQGVLRGCPCWSLPNSLLPLPADLEIKLHLAPHPLQGQGCSETAGRMGNGKSDQSPNTSGSFPSTPPWHLASWLRY